MIRIGNFKATNEMKNYIDEILETGKISEGPFTKKFENETKKFLNVENALAVTNGTVALQLIGHYLMNTKGKQKVCVPALTFPATLNAFMLSGHETMLCDVGEDMQIDINTLSEEQKYEIDVVVVVHLMGYSANMDQIMENAKKYKWMVVEDTAESFGAEYKGKKLGTFGDFGTYSFYVSHNITGGELGLVVCKDTKVAEILISMKKHGRDFNSPLEFRHLYIGSNYKTTEFCSAVALSQINMVEKLLKTRFENAKFYHDNIKNPKLQGYPVESGFSPLGYPIKCESESDRDSFCNRLNKSGVETRHIFPCLSNQPAYKEILKSYPMAEKIEKTVFYIGVHHLLRKEDLQKIVDVLNK